MLKFTSLDNSSNDRALDVLYNSRISIALRHCKKDIHRRFRAVKVVYLDHMSPELTECAYTIAVDMQ